MGDERPMQLLRSAKQYRVDLYAIDARHIQSVGFLPLSRIILMTTTMPISGLNTQPVSSIRPASDSRLRFCPWISLLTRWLSASIRNYSDIYLWTNLI